MKHEQQEPRFEQLVDGAMFIHQSGEHYSQSCCDCGSAHNIKLTVISAEEIEVQLYKNIGLTRESRRVGGQNGVLFEPKVYEALMLVCRSLAYKKLPKKTRKEIRILAKWVLEAQEQFDKDVKSGEFLS